MRGQRAKTRAMTGGKGNIPARAGPTQNCATVCNTYWEHPRPCGANGNREWDAALAAGTSPPVRGRPERPAPGSLVMGNIPPGVRGQHNPVCFKRPCSWKIPARADPTFWHWSSQTAHWEYPPHVHGQPMLLLAPDVYLRNIPACAGPTPALPPLQGVEREHPLTCGANFPILSS